MKNFKLYSGGVVFLYSLVILFNSCNKDSDDLPNGLGYVSLNFSVEPEITINENRFKSANLEEFMVNFFTSDDQLYRSYDKLLDMPDAVELEVGSYYVEVSSNDLQNAAFDSPFYRGLSEVFLVNIEETTDVSVVCALSNIAVSVVYTQNVVDDFEDYNTTVGSLGGSLVYGKEESRIGYFAQGPLHIECVLAYRNAQNNLLTRTVSADIDNLELRKHYEIQIDLHLNEPQAALNVSLDESVENEIIVLTGGQPSGIAAGDIIMTEFMANPDILSDGDGEWMEFYNTTSEVIDLQNFSVTRVGSSSSFTITESLEIPSGSYIVLAVDEQATPAVDYVYNSFSLTNSSGQIQLTSPEGTVISDISYSSAQVSAGRSAQLCPDFFGVNDYDKMDNWTLSDVEYMAGNTGSPGDPNEACN